MDLLLLHEIAGERAAAWVEAGACWSVTDGRPTDKPAAWLDLATDTCTGRLILWTSGEVEIEWVDVQIDGQRHYEVDGPSAVRACIDDLERELRLG